MSHSFVRPIVKKNLNLQTFRRREVQLLSDVEKKKRLRPCQRLKVRMTADKMAQTWFSNEKLFTVQTPTNIQNDSIYAAVSNTRLLKGRNTSLRVSCGLSKHGKTSLLFVDRGAKVNSSYYCDYVLGSNGLRDICRLSDNHFIFQQDGAPAHRSRQTVAFLTANVAGVHRARELATEQPRHQSGRLLHLGSTATTCPSTENSGSRSLERSVDELLGTDQLGIDRQSNRPVAGQNFVGDSGQRRAY